jgi:hypothetical protein
MSVETDGGGASRTTEPAAGTSAATDVSIREYFEALRRNDSAKSRERLAWLVAVGGIVWFEIQRRLENLNHENARILAAQERSVSSDTYQANEQQRKSESQELAEWRKDVDRDRTQSISRDEFQRDTKSDRHSSIDTTTKIIGAILAAAVLLLGILNYTALHHVTDTPPVTVTVPTTAAP